MSGVTVQNPVVMATWHLVLCTPALVDLSIC